MDASEVKGFVVILCKKFSFYKLFLPTFFLSDFQQGRFKPYLHHPWNQKQEFPSEWREDIPKKRFKYIYVLSLSTVLERANVINLHIGRKESAIY